MAKAVRWTEIAWSDLDAVADYIARDSRYYSAAFVRQVRSAARSLRMFPERGSIVPEMDDDLIRELYIRQYRLIYRITTKTVFILGLIHGARELNRLLSRRDLGVPPENG
jgi:plasmid stabilization system protein ParE